MPTLLLTDLIGSTEVPEDTDWLAHRPYVLKGVAPLSPPPDSEKARRAVAAGDEVTLGWRPAPGLEMEARPNWVLREKLGEGGFGEVWLVEHGKTHEKRTFKFCFQADRLRGLKREVVLFRVLKESPDSLLPHLPPGSARLDRLRKNLERCLHVPALTPVTP